jgi:hypothetical protein
MVAPQRSLGLVSISRDLVRQAVALSESKRSPLRVEHARYINFISDYMADNNGAAHDDTVRAWHAIKAMDAPKTYAAWVWLARRCGPS